MKMIGYSWFDGLIILVRFHIFFCARGACYLSLSKYEEVLSDCTDSIEFDKNYVKVDFAYYYNFNNIMLV